MNSDTKPTLLTKAQHEHQPQLVSCCSRAIFGDHPLSSLLCSLAAGCSSLSGVPRPWDITVSQWSSRGAVWRSALQKTLMCQVALLPLCASWHQCSDKQDVTKPWEMFPEETLTVSEKPRIWSLDRREGQGIAGSSQSQLPGLLNFSWL